MKHGGCLHQYGRGSTRTALRLLQRNEKNSVRLNEVCIRAHATHIATSFIMRARDTTTCDANARRIRRTQIADIAKSSMK